MSKRHITRKVLVKFLEALPPGEDGGGEIDPAAPAVPGGPFVPGQRVSKYRLVRLVGKGGMGWVYEAEDTELHRRVALKILRREWAETGATRRFEREATIAAKLQHPNIVPLYDFGVAESAEGGRIHFMAMALVKGRPLSDLIALKLPSRPAFLRILEDVAVGVAHAHANGVIHRDLKPANIMVDSDGRALLTDFGLAHAESFETQLTRTSSVMGTPFYMAPEQVLGKTREIGSRTDVYALGVMLYECLAGHVPFGGGTPAEVYQGILGDRPPRFTGSTSRVHADLALVCMKAMERRAEDRYAGASDFAEDLARFRRGEPVTAKSPSYITRIGRLFRRRRAAALSVTIAIGALAVVSATVFIPAMNRQRREIAAKDRQLIEAALKSADGLLGNLYYARRQNDPSQMKLLAGKLESECEELIRQVPGAPEPFYIRGRLRRAMMKPDLALTDLDRALSLRPDYAAAAFERTLVLTTLYHYLRWDTHSDAILQGLLQLHREDRGSIPPSDSMKAAASRIQAEVGMLLERPDRIPELPRGAIDLLRGLSAATAGNREAARRDLKAAFEVNPDLIEAYEHLIVFDSEDGKNDEAIALASQAIERDRGYSTFYSWRAFFRKRKAREMDRGPEAIDLMKRSIEDANQSLAIHPGNSKMLTHRADAHHALARMIELAGEDCCNEWSLAMADSREAYRVDPDDGHRLSLAGYLMCQGEWLTRVRRDAAPVLAEAMEHLEAVIRIRPQLDFPHYWLGACHKAMAEHVASHGGDPKPHLERAIPAWTNVLDANPAYPHVRFRRGMALLELARLTREAEVTRLTLLGQAIRDLTTLLEKEETPDVRRSRASAFLLMARTRLPSDESRDDLDAAIRDFDVVLNANPALLSALKERAQALLLRIGKDLKVDRTDLSERCIEEYAALAARYPRDWEIQTKRAYACAIIAHQRGGLGKEVLRECKEALEALAVACELKPETRADPQLKPFISWCEKYVQAREAPKR